MMVCGGIGSMPAFAVSTDPKLAMLNLRALCGVGR